MDNLLYTFVIPAYNGEKYLDISTHSLVNDRILEEKLMGLYEIIIINDGSTDNTSSKAKAIAKRWNDQIRPDFIKVIDKKNGQYGSVINRGIKEAKGKYFKVLDCDDTFHVESFIQTLHITKSIEHPVDIIFTDHTFEKIGTDQSILQSLRKNFVPYKITKVAEQKFPNDVVTMHSIIYRTQFLKDINYNQVEGVFYSDSQYSLLPTTQAKTMYYIKVPLYRYYIGRQEQSINLKVMVKNRVDQIIVLEKIITSIDFSKMKSKKVIKNAILFIRRMIQWQAMIIAFDKTIKHKNIEILSLIKVVKLHQPKYASKILNSLFFWVVRPVRGRFICKIIVVGAKIYARFKKNILAEWD